LTLVDSSAWIEVFRRGSHLDLPSIVDIEEIVTCLPVIQEVLQGFDDQRAFALAKEAMGAFPVVESPMTFAVYEQAVDLYRAARRAGVTVRSGVDCLIATCAIRNHLEVLHCDRDFDELARIAPLRTRRV
jgi:predicted nucleic acid-binding protein